MVRSGIMCSQAETSRKTIDKASCNQLRHDKATTDGTGNRLLWSTQRHQIFYTIVTDRGLGRLCAEMAVRPGAMRNQAESSRTNSDKASFNQLRLHENTAKGIGKRPLWTTQHHQISFTIVIDRGLARMYGKIAARSAKHCNQAQTSRKTSDEARGNHFQHFLGNVYSCELRKNESARAGSGQIWFKDSEKVCVFHIPA